MTSSNGSVPADCAKDRWERLRVEEEWGACRAMSVSTGQPCRRSGHYAGLCHQHHPNAGAIVDAQLELNRRVRHLVRAALEIKPGLVDAVARCRKALSALESLEAARG